MNISDFYYFFHNILKKEYPSKYERDYFFFINM